MFKFAQTRDTVCRSSGSVPSTSILRNMTFAYNHVKQSLHNLWQCHTAVWYFTIPLGPNYIGYRNWCSAITGSLVFSACFKENCHFWYFHHRVAAIISSKEGFKSWYHNNANSRRHCFLKTFIPPVSSLLGNWDPFWGSLGLIWYLSDWRVNEILIRKMADEYIHGDIRTLWYVICSFQFSGVDMWPKFQAI